MAIRSSPYVISAETGRRSMPPACWKYVNCVISMPVEPDLPAEAPRAQRGRLPVVLHEADVVTARIDAERLRRLSRYSCLDVVGRRLEDDLELVVSLQPVRVLAVAAVGGPPRRLHVGDASRAPGRARGGRCRGAWCPPRPRDRTAAGSGSRARPSSAEARGSDPGRSRVGSARWPARLTSRKNREARVGCPIKRDTWVSRSSRSSRPAGPRRKGSPPPRRGYAAARGPPPPRVRRQAAGARAGAAPHSTRPPPRRVNGVDARGPRAAAAHAAIEPKPMPERVDAAHAEGNRDSARAGPPRAMASSARTSCPYTAGLASRSAVSRPRTPRSRPPPPAAPGRRARARRARSRRSGRSARGRSAPCRRTRAGPA